MTRRRRQAVVAAVTSLMATLLLTGPVMADFFQGNDSVDNGEIRYESYTQYTSELSNAISRWNALGKINIAPDAWNTNADLHIVDWEDCNSGAVAYWQPQEGADVIQINRCFMNQYSGQQKRVVVLHEFGHALGHGDHPDGWSSSSLMFYCAPCTYFDYIPYHDQQDHYTIWP